MLAPDLLSASPFLLPALAGAIFVLAGLVKGVVGLGLPTIAMALLALMMTPAQAAALLIIPSLITNIWQIRPWNTLGPLLKRLAPMQAGVLAGTIAGSLALGAPAGAWATLSLGAALIAYAAWGLSGAKMTVRAQDEGWMGPLIGAVTGVITAATGVFVIPAVPFLQALGLERDELIQAMGISFTVSTIALALGLYFNGRYPVSALGLSFVMLLPALVGMQLGTALRKRLSPAVFRKCFLISLILLGTHMIVYELLAR
ncbi:membrane protein, putative [plant metagenome]|uniref:Membrane protein, putative n=1 Tax=plant metagenome TaxID=1297885 RepID=A0A484TCP9_9ZZZZ